MKLAERMKTLRLEKKLRQEDAAKELGLSMSSYCRYEYGEREPNASALWRMADFYGVTIDYLVGRPKREGENMMKLETARLLLRPWEDADAEILYRWASDPDVGPRAGWPPHTSVENSLEIIHGPLGEPETYAMVLKETGLPVGSIGLFPPEEYCLPLELPEGAVQLELGYWVAKPYWGMGLTPEAGRELLRYAFEELGCVVAHCSHFDFNDQSRRVIEKLGFTYRTTREVDCPQLGERRTDLCYILTREEWEKTR